MLTGEVIKLVERQAKVRVDGKLYRVVGYCDEPTIVLESCDATHSRMSVGIYSRIADDMEQVQD